MVQKNANKLLQNKSKLKEKLVDGNAWVRFSRASSWSTFCRVSSVGGGGVGSGPAFINEKFFQ